MKRDTRPALLCITPAPAIDRTAHVERLAHDEVLRPLEMFVLPGGKGVNAARAAVALGGRAVTTGIAGGHAGRWIVEALSAEGLEPHWSFARAEARTAYVTVDAGGESVLVYERATPATPDEYDAFLRLLEERLLPACARAVVAGSIPSGLPARRHGEIVEAARRARVPLLVDVSGPGLVAALEAGPDIVKIGRVEAVESQIVGDEASAVEAAVALVDRGARLAVVTDGGEEVAAADADTIWRLSVPAIEALNPVGSGDSFNAALSLALMDGADLPTALTRGVAAGSANALTKSAASLDPLMVAALEDDVVVTSTPR
ncbi:MAG: PfkB family carbohydrate kinase [Candidatus Limnocylindrales bacterium]